MINKKIIGTIGLVGVAFIAGLFIYRDTRRDKTEIIKEIPDMGILTNLGIDMTGDGKVEVVPIAEEKLPVAPTLARSTDFPNTLSPEVKKIVIERLESTIVAIGKDRKDINNWIDLGVQRKQLGDYGGARDVWEYAKALDSNNIVPWNNLGDLYHFYLKDYIKSEENWKKMIALKPDYMQGYRGLYELYTYSMKEKSSEIPIILKQGIEKNPDAIDLKTMLAEYENPSKGTPWKI